MSAGSNYIWGFIDYVSFLVVIEMILMLPLLRVFVWVISRDQRDHIWNDSVETLLVYEEIFQKFDHFILKTCSA